MHAVEDARNRDKVSLAYFQTFSYHLKAFSKFLSFKTLTIWILFRWTLPIWWELWWNFLHFKEWSIAKKSALKFIFVIEIAMTLMEKCDSLLDGKAIAFGKLALDKANWYCQLHMGDNEPQLRDRHN